MTTIHLKTIKRIRELVTKGYKPEDISRVITNLTTQQVKDLNVFFGYDPVEKDSHYKTCYNQYVNILNFLDKDHLKQRLLQGFYTKDSFSQTFGIPYNMLKQLATDVFNMPMLWKKVTATIAAQKQKEYYYKNVYHNLTTIPELNCFLWADHDKPSLTPDLTRNANVAMLLKTSPKVLYKQFADDNGFIDSYPNKGLIHQCLLTDISQRQIKELEALNLVYIEQPFNSTSSIESTLEKYCEENGLSYTKNNRWLLRDTICHKQEVDFYFPEHQIAIEINPSYTHNSNETRLNTYKTRKEKDYHYNKYLACKRKGVSLVHLYSHDLYGENLTNYTLPKLNQKFKLVNEIDVASIEQTNDTYTFNHFLQDNQLSVDLRGDKQYVLKDKDDEMIGCFELLHVTKDTWKLINIIMKKGLIVRDVMSVITTYIKTNELAKCLIAYSNNNWYNGESFLKAGFQFIEETGPKPIFISTSDTADFLTDNDLNMLYDISPVRLRFIETLLQHKTDTKKGYDIIYHAGYKKWILFL